MAVKYTFSELKKLKAAAGLYPYLFVLVLYDPVNNFQLCLDLFLGLNCTNQRIKCMVSLKPVTL